MFRWLRRLVSLLSFVALAVSGAVFIPPAFDAWRILRERDDPVVAADMHLDALSPADYAREAEGALDENDPELAQSILSLAAEKHVLLPPDLTERVAEALAERPGLLGQVWDGAVYGEGDSAAGFAAAAATDLMVIGDVRDLVRQGLAYPDHDPVVVALAAVGVGLTAATVSSAGAAAPVKLGASVLKLAKRTGKLSARLGQDLFRLTVRAIDGEALQATLRAGRRLDWAGARAAAGKILRRDVSQELVRTGDAVGAVAGKQGPRAALDTLKTAESTAEVSRLARVAEKSGTTYRGMLRLAPRLAKAVAKTSKVFLKLAVWLASGLAWLCWLAWVMSRATWQSAKAGARGMRLLVGTPFRKPPPANGLADMA